MKKAVLGLLCAAALPFAAASAADVTVTDAGGINISGTVSESSSRAVIQIIGGFDKLTSFADIDNKDINNVYFNTVEADDKGGYAFLYTPDTTGKFYVVAVNEGDDKVSAVTVFTATAEMLDTVLEKVNSASNADDIKKIFSEESDILVSNYPRFAALNDEKYRERVYSEIISAKKGGAFDDFKAFEKAYETISAVQYTNICKSGGDAKKAADSTDLSKQSFYAEYEKMEDTQKENVFARMIGRDFKSSEEYYNIFNESVFLEQLQNEKYAANITGLIVNNAAALGIDTAGYESKSNSVNNALYKKYFKTMDEFKTTFKAEINKNTTQTSTGGGGGGGNGGGSGKNTPIVPVVPTEITNDNPKKDVFSDLSGFEWAEKEILTLAQKGVVSGREDGKFYPADNITREEFAKMLVSAFGIYDENAAADFSDSSDGQWHYRYIASALKAGIANGISDTEFGVGKEITRQDMAVMSYRAAKTIAENPVGERELFKDDFEISDYAKDAVYALKKAGIVSGMGENDFAPMKTATRAEAAKIIYLITEAVQ